MKQLLGAAVEVDRSTAPVPGQWLVLFKNGRGVQLYKSGSRAGWWNQFRWGSVTVAPLDTSLFPLAWDLSGIAIGPDLFIPELSLELTVALDPADREKEVLDLLGSRGDSFSSSLLQTLQKNVNAYVRGKLADAAPESVYRQGIEDFLFPRSGPGFADPMFAVEGARVTSVVWPQSLIDRISVVDVRDSDEIAAAHERHRADLQASVEFAQIEASERVRLEATRVQAAVELREIQSILDKAELAGLPPSAFAGPFRDHSDREIELVNKLLESPFAARRPEVIAAAMERIRGGQVGDPAVDRLATRTIDAIDPTLVERVGIKAQADEHQTQDLLSNAPFRVERPDLHSLWTEAGGDHLVAVSYASTFDRATAVFVTSRQCSIPGRLRSEIEGALAGEVLPGSLEIVQVCASDPAQALTRLFEKKVGPGITTTLQAVIRSDGSREVMVRLSGPADAVTAGLTELSDESDPWIPAVEKIFGGMLRLTR